MYINVNTTVARESHRHVIVEPPRLKFGIQERRRCCIFYKNESRIASALSFAYFGIPAFGAKLGAKECFSRSEFLSVTLASFCSKFAVSVDMQADNHTSMIAHNTVHLHLLLILLISFIRLPPHTFLILHAT